MPIAYRITDIDKLYSLKITTLYVLFKDYICNNLFLVN